MLPDSAAATWTPDPSTTHSTPDLAANKPPTSPAASATGEPEKPAIMTNNNNRVDINHAEQKKAPPAVTTPVATTTVIHHHPPKETMHDVGTPPPNGGQTLLIAYFPWEATEEDVHREFSKHCKVKRVHLVLDKNNTRPRCFGFVKFESKEEAMKALDATREGLVCLNDSRDHVWHLKAEWAKTGDMVDDANSAAGSKSTSPTNSKGKNTKSNKGGASVFKGKGKQYSKNSMYDGYSNYGGGYNSSKYSYHNSPPTAASYYSAQSATGGSSSASSYYANSNPGYSVSGYHHGSGSNANGNYHPLNSFASGGAGGPPPPLGALAGIKGSSAGGAGSYKGGNAYGSDQSYYSVPTDNSSHASTNSPELHHAQAQLLAELNYNLDTSAASTGPLLQNLLMLQQVQSLSQDPYLPPNIAALLQQQASSLANTPPPTASVPLPPTGPTTPFGQPSLFPPNPYPTAYDHPTGLDLPYDYGGPARGY
ncbi:unnamed protein product [Amoebophrya sp. A120]|nr:unnamed protein product [Amoebophrya sp. A120]|eukprot:GSA120T00016146001.1